MTPLDFESANARYWEELEAQVLQPVEELNPDRFLSLYRLCCEHLVLSQARGFPVHISERLGSVTARAHQIIYRRSEFGLARVADLLLRQFPLMVRGHWGYVALATACLMVPTLALGVAVYLHPDLILSIVDRNTAASFEEMYSPAAQAIGRARNVDSNWMMFGYYIMHNIGIGFQCFACGILLGLGSLYYLAYNGNGNQLTPAQQTNNGLYDNAAQVENNFNPVDYTGGRVSLDWQFAPDWDVLVTQSYQKLETKGTFATQTYTYDYAGQLTRVSGRATARAAR